MRSPTRLAIICVLVLCCVFVIVDYSVPSMHHLDKLLHGFMCWVSGHMLLGAVVFTVIYALSVILVVPAAILTLGAGAVFSDAVGFEYGMIVACCVVFIGATVGSCAAFLLGRYLCQGTVRRCYTKYRIMGAIDQAVTSQGFKIVALFRLSPLIPFTAFNYIISVTSVSFRSYALGSVGMIPGVIAYVFIGTLLGSTIHTRCGTDNSTAGNQQDDSHLYSQASKTKTLLLTLGIIATVLAVLLISHYARKALKEALKLEILDSGHHQQRQQHQDQEPRLELQENGLSTRRLAGKVTEAASLVEGDGLAADNSNWRNIHSI